MEEEIYLLRLLVKDIIETLDGIDEIEKKVKHKLSSLASDQKRESIKEQLAKKGYL